MIGRGILGVLTLCLPMLSWADVTLLKLINDYRQQPQRCEQMASVELAPLQEQMELQLGLTEDLNQAISSSGYPMAAVRAMSLSGPRDAQAAMEVLQQSFCGILLSPQFVDIGITQVGRDWRIVVGRPLLAARLEGPDSEGQRLMALINQARATARQCGGRAYPAVPALKWQELLASTALTHSREMANKNYFSHINADGVIPGDRVELAGYSAERLAENLAAAQDQADKVVASWLASEGHCANLMNGQFSEFGAAYAVDPSSDAGIYWTALFAKPY